MTIIIIITIIAGVSNLWVRMSPLARKGVTSGTAAHSSHKGTILLVFFFAEIFKFPRKLPISQPFAI